MQLVVGGDRLFEVVPVLEHRLVGPPGCVDELVADLGKNTRVIPTGTMSCMYSGRPAYIRGYNYGGQIHKIFKMFKNRI